MSPAAIRSADEAWLFDEPDKAPDLPDVVRFLCGDQLAEAKHLLDRYHRLTQGAPRVWVLPAHKIFLGKLVRPLRGAITDFMSGNYYGTIALTGMVCEMLAVLIFEMHAFKITGEDLTNERQKLIFGRTFEALGQDRRVKVLQAFGVIGDEMARDFDVVRELRRKHLHILTHDDAALPEDAAECYRRTIKLVEVVFRTQFDDGKISMRPQVKRFIARLKAQGPE